MGLYLAFAPFILFAIVDRLLDANAGLLAGAVASAALIAKDYAVSRGAPKLLELGTMLLFAGLSLYSAFAGASWSIIGVRLCVDAGLLLIVLLSLALRRPFTLQYAREQATRDLWDSPRFIETNYVLTRVWALAFVVIVVADMVLLFAPALPPSVGITATILALVAAAKVTAWYPQHAAAAQAAK